MDIEILLYIILVVFLLHIVICSFLIKVNNDLIKAYDRLLNSYKEVNKSNDRLRDSLESIVRLAWPKFDEKCKDLGDYREYQREKMEKELKENSEDKMGSKNEIQS